MIKSISWKKWPSVIRTWEQKTWRVELGNILENNFWLACQKTGEHCHLEAICSPHSLLRIPLFITSVVFSEIPVSSQAHSIADNSHYWKLLENMVSLFHVPLLVSDWSFSCTFYLLLSRSVIHHIFSFAKALEGQTAF